jgi:hypothetical protein
MVKRYGFFIVEVVFPGGVTFPETKDKKVGRKIYKPKAYK